LFIPNPLKGMGIPRAFFKLVARSPDQRAVSIDETPVNSKVWTVFSVQGETKKEIFPAKDIFSDHQVLSPDNQYLALNYEECTLHVYSKNQRKLHPSRTDKHKAGTAFGFCPFPTPPNAARPLLALLQDRKSANRHLSLGS
ncbi:MAG: hypothetical protein IV090_27650, partial [Candidatus Sericytochromatia bacterium]|nr:hypothetical protein [Candidatus Sericytochromatia bacterium]